MICGERKEETDLTEETNVNITSIIRSLPRKVSHLSTYPSQKILAVIQRKHIINWPKAIRTPAKTKSRDKWCKFYKDHDYDIED